MKKIFLGCFLLGIKILTAQVGIGSKNPLGTFHIDGGRDNKDIVNSSQLMGTEAERNDFIITANNKVGIKTINPNEALDVNGKARIRDLEILKSSTNYSLCANGEGVLGKCSPVEQEKKAAYYFKTDEFTYSPYGLSSYNSGYRVAVPIASNDTFLNTLLTSVGNNYQVKVPSSGYFLIGGGINFYIGFDSKITPIYQKDFAKVYIAANIEVSSDGGNLWKSITGCRTLFEILRLPNHVFIVNKPLTIPTVLTELKSNDLIRVVFYRTRDANGNLEGEALDALDIKAAYGGPGYSLSISKL
ncbi:hypothetical protein [Chryseobacterium oryctis]|uniref:Uncharacterized protein n=1 Tax=Chryseobacterium oryctis TaxID=2952618 RepID=A0ABT3HP97_9FLAO|nr:hypothetical protein [Chryseobacterium oryctis]MCW3161612.1 hypothetical protein [Chryseobacterium oryctis]